LNVDSLLQNNNHKDEDLRPLINDAIHFVKMFSKPINKSASHTYISALSFAPRSSRIYKHYQATCGCSMNVLTGALEEWPQYIWQSGGHKHSVSSVCFSPDGKQIVSGSGDITICLWDAASGQLVGSPLEGHRGWVRSVAFSPDGKQIVSGSDDATICLWDAVSGQLVGSPLKGHSSGVTSVAFSPDGKQIVSSSGDTTILWDAASGQLIGSPLNGHSSMVRSVVFSPDVKDIVSCYYDGAVHLRNPATGKFDTCQESLTDTKLISLTVADGWVRDARDNSLLYCIPAHNFSTDVWAFSGAKLAMGNTIGKVTIIDATRVFQSRGLSV